MYELGIISGARMREFDEMCLTRELETDEPKEHAAMEVVTA